MTFIRRISTIPTPTDDSSESLAVSETPASPCVAALIVVDVQNDFVLPTGALSVPDGESILPLVLSLRARPFAMVAYSQDHHPAGHVSFISSRPRASVTTLATQTADPAVAEAGAAAGPGEMERSNEAASRYIWPDHCVQGTEGACFHPSLGLPPPPLPSAQAEEPSSACKGECSDQDKRCVGPAGWYELPPTLSSSKSGAGAAQRVVVVRKGENKSVDSYSAFMDNDRLTHTALEHLLRAARVTHVYVCGLAFDYCVAYTALDAKALGFAVTVVTDACRSVAPVSAAAAHEKLTAAGVRLIDAAEAEREVEALAAAAAAGAAVPTSAAAEKSTL